MPDRRAFLHFPLAVLLPEGGQYNYRYDGVLGTSLDLAVSGVSQSTANRVEAIIVEEIERLRRILSTYDASSEISRVNHSLARGERAHCSQELFELLEAYNYWQAVTKGVISPTLHRQHLSLQASDRSVASPIRLPLNVDALGKAFIIDKAVSAASTKAPSASIRLNIGGDLVARGAHPVGIVDPQAHADNDTPLATLNLHNAAVTTSGSLARGRHIVDARTGLASTLEHTATVVASNAVTANALSTALCALAPEDGIQLVKQIKGAQALVITPTGKQYRSSGFRFQLAQAPAKWPAGFQVEITFTLKPHQQAFLQRPYVAVWVESSKEDHIKTLAAWVGNRRWMRELYYWTRSYSEIADPGSITKPTRTPGLYKFTWDGTDHKGTPVPPGNYSIHFETSREHGPYCKQSVVLACGGDKPISVVTKDTEDFLPAQVNYVMKPQVG